MNSSYFDLMIKRVEKQESSGAFSGFLYLEVSNVQRNILIHSLRVCLNFSSGESLNKDTGAKVEYFILC